MNQTEIINTALNILKQNGHTAYLVGGFVRDLIMNVSCHDIDIATSASATQTIAAFCDYKVIETGLQHGTVTVMIEHTPIEITTYRIDGNYTDGRHPDQVVFCDDIIEDLKRRDFTINSIAFDNVDTFIDPFGGQADIQKQVIRCVGDARKRFSEDSLRILRALRFSSTLGFEIEEETSKAIFELKHTLNKVSIERVYSEFCKLICGKDATRVLRDYFDVIVEFLPELKACKNFNQHNFHHIYDVLEHTLMVVQNIEPKLHLKLAALFHDVGKPSCFSLDENGIGHFYSHASVSTKMTDEVLKRLKCDTKTREQVTKLISAHDAPIEPQERLIKKRLSRLGEEMFFDLIKLKRADNLGQNPEYFYRQKENDEIEKIAQEIIKENQCFSLKNLEINGHDLIKLGLSGIKIGEMLNLCLNEVIEGKIKNEKSVLIDFAESNR